METKKPWHSLGEWGAVIIAVCGLVLPVFGQADFAKFLQEEQAGIIEWLSAVGVLIGSLMAFVGRWRATKKISL